MKESAICKNCGNILSSSNFEICDDCKKNHIFSKFLKNLIDFLGEAVFFEDNDLEKIGIDELDVNEYIWELFKLKLITLHNGKYFIKKNLTYEFIEKHYIDDCEDSNAYDPLKVKIADNPNYRKDILNLIENIEFINESDNVPFPQADDLNRLIFIGQQLLKKDLTKDEVKGINKVHNRIVDMYTRAGFYFEIFEEYNSQNNVYYKLSIKGKSIFELDEYNRNMGICHCILEHEIFYRIFNICLENEEIKLDSIIKIMNQYDLKLNSEVTLRRRAGCVSSWMHWIFKLMYPHKKF